MDANAKLNAARPLDRRGVNIAARLEGIAKPGAICISEDAYRRVKARLDLPVSDLGAIQLKNIAEPVRVFSLQVGGSTTTKTTKRRRSKAALDIPVGGTVDRRACGDFGRRVVARSHLYFGRRLSAGEGAARSSCERSKAPTKIHRR